MTVFLLLSVHDWNRVHVVWAFKKSEKYSQSYRLSPVIFFTTFLCTLITCHMAPKSLFQNKFAKVASLGWPLSCHTLNYHVFQLFQGTYFLFVRFCKFSHSAKDVRNLPGKRILRNPWILSHKTCTAVFGNIVCDRMQQTFITKAMVQIGPDTVCTPEINHLFSEN